MKLRNHLFAAMIGACSLGAAAQEPWVHVYCNPTTATPDNPDSYNKPEGVFYSMPMSDVDSIFFTTNSAGKFNRLRLNGLGHKYSISMSTIRKWNIGPDVPAFRIDLPENPDLTEVKSKEDYLDGILTIDGRGVADDFSGEIKVRGRGNSTWNYAKKAYRLKLPVKTKLCGYRKAKNYVLLANYIDQSMMRNEAACLATQYVGMPYPTHARAVDVFFNNTLKGSYMLIEKVGINNGSVNIPAADEAKSIMFELDTNYDEELRQSSENFRLPVMLKDPDAPEDPAEARIWFAEWMADFNEMERAVFEGNNIGDYIDYTTLAKYLLVYNLACNQELNHPKSVYLYKTEGGKYNFGPCWDFDWAFGYEPTYRAESHEGEIDEATARAMIDEVKAYIHANGLGEYMWFDYKGQGFVWLGGDTFLVQGPDGQYNSHWPYASKTYAPSYQNFLLGHGRNNQGTQNGMGNGGEFFLSIIMNNPEFMAEYKAVWEQFKSHLPEFWAEFNAYAKALEPSAARNSTVWRNNYLAGAIDPEFLGTENTPDAAVEVLRTWLEKRIEFIGDESKNFGLYDPHTSYSPASANQ